MAVSEQLKTTDVTYSPLLRRYTLEEFWALPEPADRTTYELIEGVIYMSPPPDPPHGEIDARLTDSLVTFLAAHGRPGGVYHPREPIYIEGTYLEPDMMYVSNELRARMDKRRTCADIVFEYLSKSSAIYDRTTKADTYLALGVRELWLVDSDTKSIEVGNAIPPVVTGELPKWGIRRFGAGEWAESQVLLGWRVSVDELFDGLE